jgi:hypothetical protein
MPTHYSNAQFPDQKFSMHGRYDLHVADGIYMVCVVGPLNLECMKGLGKARAAAFAQWQGEVPKVGIAVFHSSMLMSLEALDAYTADLRRDLQSTGKWEALAWVAGPEVEGRDIMVSRFSKIFAEHHVPWKIFDEIETARAWIGDARRTVN